jgi:pyrroloquinoline-quinone synthase
MPPEKLLQPLRNERFLNRLRAVGVRRYHHNHPFHLAMNAGELSPTAIRTWVANRFYYQKNIPVKDAAIISNCPLREVRRLWLHRLIDHDGVRAKEGGIEAWLRLAAACGMSRIEILDERHVLPGVRFAVDAYVNFARSQPWPVAVASSLTELFAPDLMAKRLQAFEKHYSWVRPEGFDYFRRRVTQARTDSQEALKLTTIHCNTEALRDQAVRALSFKCDVLWSILDAIQVACGTASIKTATPKPYPFSPAIKHPDNRLMNKKTRIPIGFQLWAVRGEFSRDVRGTLGKLAEMGYQGVEFWDYAGTPQLYQNYSASALRDLLDQNALRCCGIHVKLEALRTENLRQTIENSRILGNEYLTLAGAKECMADKNQITRLAQLLNKASAACLPHKIVVGYHAHPFDFKKINRRFAWELLFEQLNPKVNMQMDVGNCLAGKGDPLAMLNKFPNRTWTIHLKEHKEKTFQSDYYAEIFRLCENGSVTQWYIVEVGGVLGKGFKATRTAIQKLTSLGK